MDALSSRCRCRKRMLSPMPVHRSLRSSSARPWPPLLRLRRSPRRTQPLTRKPPAAGARARSDAARYASPADARAQPRANAACRARGAHARAQPTLHADAPSRARVPSGREQPGSGAARCLTDARRRLGRAASAAREGGADRRRSAAASTARDRRRNATASAAAREGDSARRRSAAARASSAAAERAVGRSRGDCRRPLCARPIRRSRRGGPLRRAPKLATGTDRSDRASQAVSRRRRRPIGRRQSCFQHRS